MRKEFKSDKPNQILTLTMALAVAGLFTIPPALAGSLSGGVTGSRAGNLGTTQSMSRTGGLTGSRAGNIATTKATTSAGAYGWGRQTYLNRHFIPKGYSLSSGSYRASSNNYAAKEYVYSNHGGSTTQRKYKPNRSTATPSQVTTYKWGMEKNNLVEKKTLYK